MSSSMLYFGCVFTITTVESTEARSNWERQKRTNCEWKIREESTAQRKCVWEIVQVQICLREREREPFLYFQSIEFKEPVAIKVHS